MTVERQVKPSIPTQKHNIESADRQEVDSGNPHETIIFGDIQERRSFFPVALERKSFVNISKDTRPATKTMNRFLQAFGTERQEGETDEELFQRKREEIYSKEIAEKSGVNKSEISRLARSLGLRDLKLQSRKRFDSPGIIKSNEKKLHYGKRSYSQENPNTSAFRGYRKFMEVFGSERKVDETDKELFERIRDNYSIRQFYEITGMHSREMGSLKKVLGAKNMTRGAKRN